MRKAQAELGLGHYEDGVGVSFHIITTTLCIAGLWVLISERERFSPFGPRRHALEYQPRSRRRTSAARVARPA